MHRTATKGVWMADERGIPGNDDFLFGLEDSLQVTGWRGYVNM